MAIVRRILFGLLLLVLLSVTGLIVVGYGWVPLFGFEQIDDYFGEPPPDSWVAWYGAGWTDHRLYLIFKEDPEWIERAAQHAVLVPIGSMSRDECLDSFSTPWWFGLAPGTQGICWQRQEGWAGNLRMHVAPSGFVYVFDYST